MRPINTPSPQKGLRNAVIRLTFAASLLASACTGDTQPLPSVDIEGAEKAVVDLIEERRQAVLAGPSPESWGRLGMAYHAHDFNSAAAQCYATAAGLAPDRYRWWYLAGLAVASSDSRAAEPYFEKAAALEPSNPVVFIQYGDLLLEQGREQEAQSQYRKALALDDRSTHALYGLARVDLMNDQLDAARKQLEQAREIAPHHGEARLLLSQVYHRLGMEDAAAREAEAAQAFPEPSTAEDPVFADVLEQSASSTALTRRGMAEARRGEYARAEALFRRVIENGRGNARDYANLGASLAGQNRLDEAFTEYRKALDIDPRESYAHYNLGLALAQTGRHEEADQHLQEALEIDPTYAEAHNALGLLALEKGDKSAAMAAFREAVRLNPGLLSARSNLAKALADSGQIEAAVGQWESGLEIDPSHLETLYNLAVAYSLQGDYAAAVRRFERGLLLAPASSLFARGLAWLLATAPEVELRDGPRAVQLAQSIVQQYPQDVQAADLLAAALAETGRFAEAAELAAKALDDARKQGHQELAAQIGSRLRLYRNQTPFRQAGKM